MPKNVCKHHLTGIKLLLYELLGSKTVLILQYRYFKHR